MLKTVEKFLIENNIKNKTVIIGFSAGPDSCALALLLSELQNKLNLKLILANFNHNWRKEALFEEEFTKDFAKKINAEFYIEKAPKNSPKTEENARKLRYNFFEKTADLFKSDVVLLAHNKTDNIETLIYRIIKGTSIKGLSAIPEIRDIYYRPLLQISKEEILNYLKSKKQNYCIDNSNEDINFNRNYIRKNILPLFEKINPNYITNINNLIENANDTKKILEDKLSEINEHIKQGDNYSLNKYMALNKAYRLEFLNNYLGKHLKYRDSKTIKRFDTFLNQDKSKKISINKDLFLEIKKDYFYISKKAITKKQYEIAINSTGDFYFENIILHIEKINSLPKILPNKKENYCYLNLPDNFSLTLRHRKNGDIFTPLGVKSDKMKLKDYLINSKIQQEQKDELILLCNKNEVIWVLGNQINEKYKVVSNNCYKISWRMKNDKKH